MRESFTAVLERNRTLAGEFATEPYEVAWAAEARWFVRTLERTGTGARMRVTTQVSPTGCTGATSTPSGRWPATWPPGSRRGSAAGCG